MNNQLRDAEMLRMYIVDKCTLAMIGEKFGFSRQRIDQLLSKFDVYKNKGKKKNRNPLFALKIKNCDQCGKDYTGLNSRFCSNACHLTNRGFTKRKPEDAKALKRAYFKDCYHRILKKDPNFKAITKERNRKAILKRKSK